MTPTAYRNRRAQLGLTQRQLADALKVSRATINRREQGLMPITRESELALLSLERAALKKARELSLHAFCKP